jgi:hypothetical protein
MAFDPTQPFEEVPFDPTQPFEEVGSDNAPAPMEPVAEIPSTQEQDDKAYVLSLNPNTKQGITELQNIMHGNSNITSPELRRLASDRFYSKVPSNVERIEFNDPRNPNKGSVVRKGSGRMLADVAFGKEAVQRQLTDEGGVIEGAKSAADYALGLGSLPSRALGSFLGQGDVTSEGTYALKGLQSDPDAEGIFETDTPMGSTRATMVNTLKNSLGTLYKKELAQTDPAKRQRIKAMRIETQSELEDLGDESYLEIMEEIGSMALSDPGMLRSGVLKGLSTGKKLLGMADEGADVAETLKYGAREVVDEVAPVIAPDGTLTAAKAEELASTLVTPPQGFDDVGQTARNMRFDDYNKASGIEEDVLDIIPETKKSRLIDYGRLKQDMLEQGEMGGVEDEILNTLMNQARLRKSKDIVGETLQDVKGIQRPDGVRETNSAGWDYLKSTESGNKELSEYLATNAPNGVGIDSWNTGIFGATDPTFVLELSMRTDPDWAANFNAFIGGFNKSGMDAALSDSEKALTKIFNSNAKPALRKLSKDLLGIFETGKTPSAHTISRTTSKIDEVLRTMEPSDPYFSEFKNMSNQLKELKTGAVEAVLDEVPARYLNTAVNYFGKGVPFKSGYKKLKQDVASISKISSRLLDNMAIKKTSNLTDAEWDNVTKKVNSYVSKIMNSKNKNEVANVKESISDLETFLKGKGIDFKLVDAIDSYKEITKFATPKVKNGEVVGFTMGEGFLKELGNTFDKSLVAGSLKSIGKALDLSLTSVDKLTETEVLGLLNSKKAKPFVTKFADKLGIDNTFARRILATNLKAGIGLGRAAKQQSMANDQEQTDPTGFSLSGK